MQRFLVTRHTGDTDMPDDRKSDGLRSRDGLLYVPLG